MQRAWRFPAWLALVAMMTAGCSATRFVSTWKDPSAGPFQLEGRKVAALVTVSSEGVRRQAEDELAAELDKRGADGEAGYRVLNPPDLSDPDAARQQLQAAGISAAIVVRPVGTTQEVSIEPGAWWDRPRYRTFRGYWGYGGNAFYEPPTVRTNTVVFIETMVYDVASGQLLWAGKTRSMNPDRVDRTVRELADKLEGRLRRDGLLQ